MRVKAKQKPMCPLPRFHHPKTPSGKRKSVWLAMLDG